MKFTRLFLLLTCSAHLALASPPNGVVTEEEKQWFTDYEQETAAFLQGMLKDVDPEDWDFRSAPERWTIAECAEHILLSEKALLNQIRQLSEKGMPEPDKQSAVPNHETIVNLVTDRINKRITTAEVFEPIGKWTSKESFLLAFADHRKALINYLGSLKAPVHHLFANSPFGEIDLFQLSVVALAHTTRHTLQIEEIKAELGLETTALRLESGKRFVLDKEGMAQLQQLFVEILQQQSIEMPNKAYIQMSGGGKLKYRLSPSGAKDVEKKIIFITVPVHQWDSVKRRFLAFGMEQDGDVFRKNGIPRIRLLPRNRQ